MVTTYKISDKLQKDFRDTCVSKGIAPAKALRRAIALLTIKPDTFNKILTQDFLMEVAKVYGFGDL